MNSGSLNRLEESYPRCRTLFAGTVWSCILEEYLGQRVDRPFPDFLSARTDQFELPPFLPDLARLEEAVVRARTAETPSYSNLTQVTVNPSLQLIHLSWKNLSQLVKTGLNLQSSRPEPGDEWVLVWRHPHTSEIGIRPATDQDLLALKLVAEDMDFRIVAREHKVPVSHLEEVVNRCALMGLLLRPPSRIRRDPSVYLAGGVSHEQYQASPVFTLQWHITQACDLHCKHCYDRSNRDSLQLDQAFRVLDDLYDFCRFHCVKGQVSFTGGNPLLYPGFTDLYRRTVELGFQVAILGNPVPKKYIEELLAIEPPVYYQVSLEGLSEHNDRVRQTGHFHRTMEFLHALRDLNIFSMVMLTLTKDNLSQVLPLAEMLRGKTDLFTFNRLSLVGEGAKLQLPEDKQFASFLEAYSEAAKTNPVIGFKDNLLNIARFQKGRELFGGCCGFGCGAAFNFISVLPDGEAHACRKFPSPIGNVLKDGIGGVYHSDMAKRYRRGSRACDPCPIRPVCGGCLAITYSLGRDVFEERDPLCFMNSSALSEDLIRRHSFA
jgi:selenobiotic family peptide radical SAM maturase